MKSISTDPRAQRTRELLRQALIKIVPEKPFRELTIRDITSTAQVNRATFYLHYDDKYDLLHDCAKVLFEEIRQGIETEFGFDPTQIALESVSQHGKRMQNVLLHIQDHSAFYRAMFRDDGDPLFHNLFRDNASTWIKSQVMLVFEQHGTHVDEELIDMMVRFQSAGNFDVIGWWLENDMQVPVDIMANRLAMITVPTLIRWLCDDAMNLSDNPSG